MTLSCPRLLFPSRNEVGNVMSLTTNETGFIFVSSGLHLHEQASEMQCSEVNNGVPACSSHFDMPAFGA